MATATYILPIRRSSDLGVDELTAYLRDIADQCELIIVDGSDQKLFDSAHTKWAPFSLHVPPDVAIGGLNAKVRGVLTGVHLAAHERIVIADDDVRYGPAELERAVAALDDAELVRPQNVFASMPWHARWDTARTLLNRSIGADSPGTLAVRRSALVAAGGYDADVLFENLELIRTLTIAGGREARVADLYVRRLPPSASHFWSQRVRQAYDELARPWRLALFLALAPGGLFLATRRSKIRFVPVAAIIGSVALAERGRRRAGGKHAFPASASWLAPIWLLERSICSWLAVGARLRGGCRYSGTRIRTAATPRRVLRRRLRT